MDFSSFDLNFNPVQNVQTYEVCTVFSVNFSSGLKEDTPHCTDYNLRYALIYPVKGDNQMPFDILNLNKKNERTRYLPNFQ